MSENQPVNPAEVPVFTGNLELLDEKVKALSGAGGRIATAAGDVHSSFGGLSAFYKAPEAEQLFATTQPVKDKALDISGDMCTIAGALGTYASDIRPLKQKLDDLRRDAVTFRQKIAEDDKWREDGDLVEENNNRRNEIAEVWTQFQAAERSAHAKIVALVGGKALKVNDGSNGEGMYGYDAEALKQAKSLPWGDAVEESTPWWQVWEHAYDFGKGVIVDGVWGTIKGLGTLVGFQGWDAAGQAWKGLGLLATGLVITATPLAGAYWMADDKDLPGWIRDSRTAMKETGKALVAWDQWGSNPARAAGAVTFNVLTTVFTGGAGGAVSGAGKAGAAARAISFAGKAGRAIDPTTYLFKGAGAGITKIGDVMAGLKGMGNLNVPPIPEGTFVLPEGSLMRPDGTIHLPDGTPVPPGAVEVPPNTVRLPEGTAVPPGAVDLGDGVVRLPDDTPAPAGSTPLQEGTVAVPKDTPTVPADAMPLPVKEGAPPRYLDGAGNVLDENGKVVSDIEDAPTDTVDRGANPDANPAAGADNPRVDTPAKVPAMAGAAVHAGDNTAINLGNSLDTNLGDVGRVGDDAPVRVPDSPGGLADNTPGGLADNLPTGQAGNNLPGGGAGDHLPTNNLDNTPGTGGTRDVPGGTHADTPTTGGSRDVPPGASTADNATPGGGSGASGADNGVPGTSGADNGVPGSGLPDTPGTGAVDDAAAGAGDQPVTAANREGQGDGTDGNGGERELTPEERKAIQEEHVRKANDPDRTWYNEHYDSMNRRKRVDKLVDGVELPQLVKLPDGKLVAAHDLPSGPSETKFGGKPLGLDSVPDANRSALNDAAANRKAYVDLTNAMKAHDEAPTAATEAALKSAQAAYKARLGDLPVNSKISEALGEKAAELHVVPAKFENAEPIPLPKTPNGADMFDQVYKLEDDTYLIVEAKAPSGDLDWRHGKADPDPANPTDHGGAAGMRVKQGTRLYIRTILGEMQRRGGRDAEIAADLRAALREGNLQYVMVKAIKPNGSSYAGATLEYFKI
ncbi:hypothetical protein [Streptomyces lavendofoliae]|uniref:Uncharacterized protein n=1 Tax=Streptomyces lavendofoliae TaxID=67314 RepID=A0A918M3S3_9ACTN|nr:hypothetical protein [Streptomyces lavendofoliae]GGU28789.1 hypothetical protein GCM10010274_14480 [Streptomyces lavendofoliae]